MTHVSYEKRQIVPSANRLVFKPKDGNVVSETITLTFKILLSSNAHLPLRQVQLKLAMIYPGFYEFLEDGPNKELYFDNVSTGFVTDEIKFRVKIIDPSVTLERKVILKATVMDVDEGVAFPLGGNYGLFTWEPAPPSESLLNKIPSNLI